MYRGKHIAKGDTIFVFASDNEWVARILARPCMIVRNGKKEFHYARF
jgi:hypothetical protein